MSAEHHAPGMVPVGRSKDGSPEPIKYMDLAEFRSEGFLQEANRLFFHPLGLALAVGFDEEGQPDSMGVWDYREDPEGIVFGDGMVSADKIARVDAERARHAEHRTAMLGAVIQPVSS